ncbi:MAG: hypothetical protein M3440_15645 [Chloroflexota bacterium]|nr:hypothetical protein [Chloroflexota bacterium]
MSTPPVTLRIPVVIDPALTGNGRAHPMKKYRLFQELKAATMLIVRTTGPDVYPIVPWILDYTVGRPKGKQALDDDNIKSAGLKAIQDGIADELGLDDRYIMIGTVTQVRDVEGLGFVEVRISEGPLSLEKYRAA